MYFPQDYPPGREAQIDFTHCNTLGVTVAGQLYSHLLFQMILSHSGWRYAEVATGETFLALQQGLPAALLDHYGLRSTRINRGQSHENGVAEQGHYRLKDAVDQAFILLKLSRFGAGWSGRWMGNFVPNRAPRNSEPPHGTATRGIFQLPQACTCLRRAGMLVVGRSLLDSCQSAISRTGPSGHRQSGNQVSSTYRGSHHEFTPFL